MITVAGNLKFDRSERDKAVDLFGPLVEQTLAEEGCVAYGFWEHPSEPGHFLAFEEWASEDAINQHMASAHMAEFLGSMGSFEQPIEVSLHRYEVSDKSKLM